MAFFRQTAARVLLTFVSVISFLGTGLHLLPGCNHFHNVRLASDPLAGAPHFSAGHHDGDCDDDSDCPICRFIAIPWALSTPPAIIDCDVHFEPVVAAPTSSPALAIARPYGARAPPRPPLFG
jgi:hypothetical protein